MYYSALLKWNSNMVNSILYSLKEIAEILIIVSIWLGLCCIIIMYFVKEDNKNKRE